VDKYDKAIFRRIFAYSKDKIHIFILGIIFALANGVIFPIFSIFLSKMLASLLKISVNPNDQEAIDNINLYALVFLILAICALVVCTVQITSFGVVG
jgi:ATP-binding cassette subfamily B (MDR/TAP) protein 1